MPTILRIQLRLACAGLAILFLFFAASPTLALDASACAQLYGQSYSGCVLLEKGAFADACQNAQGPFKAKLEQTLSSGAAQTGSACTQTFLLMYNNSQGDFAADTDIEKCVAELVNCAELFLQCQGNTGQVDMNDLESQCNYFLAGGTKNWSQFKGQDLCSAAIKSEGVWGEKCAKYTGDLEKTKAEEGLTPPAGKDQQAEYAAALAELQANAAGLNQLKTKDIRLLIGGLIAKALGVVGSIALLMFVYGGILWMTAAGSSEKTEKGRQILVWSALGVIVIFSSYALLDIVFEVFRP